MSQTPPRQTASSTSKLRDSCHACAVSKVKCHKEKPTCARCARRNITCEYFVTKRPGRKLNSGQAKSNTGNSNAVDLVTDKTTQGSWPGSINPTSDATLSTANDHPSTAPGLTPISMSPGYGIAMTATDFSSSSSSENLSELLFSIEPSLAGMSNEFDELITSPIDFLDLDTLDANTFMHETDDLTNFLLPNHTNPEPVQRAPSIHPPNPHAHTPDPPSPNAPTRATAHTHTICCLMQALDLLKPPSTKSAPCLTSKDITAASKILPACYASAQTVVVENKQTIEAVSSMLQCSCAEDSYLLVMLSMIIFQVLRRYAAAAQNQPNETSDAGASKNEQSLDRMDAQLILSELHRVQQLVNQLSPRLNPDGVSPASEAAIGSGSRAGKSLREFFSPTTLTQIEIDLRKCLSAVSSVIISMLRQF